MTLKLRFWPGFASMLLVAAPVRAHSETVHQSMTDWAYQIMLRLRADCESNVHDCWITDEGMSKSDQAAQWDAFVALAMRAPEFWQSQNSDLPLNTECRKKYGTSDEPDNKCLAPTQDYTSDSNQCGLEKYEPDGIYAVPGGMCKDVDTTGRLLGYHAAMVDREKDDWQYYPRLTNVLGVGALKALGKQALSHRFSSLIVPLLCALDCILGGCVECAGALKDIAEVGVTLASVDAVMPGQLPSWKSFLLVGQGHLINIQPKCTNEYDDHEGMFIEEAGLDRRPDVLELGVMAVFDAHGDTVDYSHSNGVKRYQVEDENDGSQNSVLRSQAEWEFTTGGHVPFTPLDNLALYGWRQFQRTDQGHRLSQFGFLLHALGDATAPQHVIGSFGWGHQPYEQAEENQWDAIRNAGATPDDDTSRAQFVQAARILHIAFDFRAQILKWQADNQTTTDLPVRELVTTLAQRTLDRAHGDNDWPYVGDDLSSKYALGAHNDAIAEYTGRADAAAHMRGYIEDGVGATIAVLMSAAEVMQP